MPAAGGKEPVGAMWFSGLIYQAVVDLHTSLLPAA